MESKQQLYWIGIMKNMVELNKFLKIIFLLILVNCSIKICGQQQMEIIHIDSVMNGRDSLTNNVYIVYCKDKNNVIYKVLTHYYKKKNKTKKIKEGEKYLLTLVSYFRKRLRRIGADYSLEIIGCDYYDNTVAIEIENDIYDLYEAKELNGLFIKQ